MNVKKPLTDSDRVAIEEAMEKLHETIKVLITIAGLNGAKRYMDLLEGQDDSISTNNTGLQTPIRTLH